MNWSLIGGLAASLLLVTGCNSSAQSADGQDVAHEQGDLMVPFDMGGGTALAVNTINQTLQDEGILDDALAVDSMPGASGMIGMTRVIVDHPGESSQLLYHTTNVLAAPMLQDSGVTYEDLTPIARLFSENEVLLVAKDSEYQSLDDLASAVKRNLEDVTVGGGTKGNADHQAAAQFAIAAGADPQSLKYVPYDGADSTAALLGHHIDVLVGGPDLLALVEGGEARALAVSSTERLGGKASDVPTFKEQGFDVVTSNSRFIFGPPEMPEDAVKQWQSIFTDMVESSSWKAAVDENMWANTFETKGLNDSLAIEDAELRKLLGTLGLIDG